MKQKSIKKNMLMSVLLTSSNFIFPIITYSYVARILSPSGTGRVAFVNSILSYFSYIAILGIPTYGLREVAKIRDNKEELSHVVQELLIISLIATLISYILMFVAVNMIPRLYVEKKLFLVMGISIFLNTIGLEWVYQGLEEYSYIAVRSIAFKVVSVFLTFTLIRTREDVVWYGFLTVFTTSASYVLNFINIKKYISLKKKKAYHFKRHFKSIMTLFAASIVITIYANFDVSMLGFISTENEVGLYNAAQKIKALVLSLSTAVTTVLIPRMSYYMKDKDTLQIYSLVEKSMRISFHMAIPVAVYIFFFGEECIILLCGNGYLGAVKILKILITCVIPLTLTNLFGNQILIPSGNEKRYSQSVFVGLWINLILNLLLIPKLGAIGAAIGTLATECWNVFYMSNGIKKFRKYLWHQISYKIYLIAMLISIVISLSSVYLIAMNGIIKLIITGSIFFGIYYGILILEKEPILYSQWKKIIRKIRGNI